MKTFLAYIIVIVLVLIYLFTPQYLVKQKYPLKYQDFIIAKSQDQNLNPALVSSVIYNESRFDPEAVSSQYAIGLMQVQVPTAKSVAKKNITQEQLKKPSLNINLGSKYLRILIDRYKERELALIAYNLGPTELDKQLKKSKDRNKLGTPYIYAQAVVNDSRIYQQVYSGELGLKQKQNLTRYQLWKIICLGESQ